jgi:hypothetical protein
MIGTLSLAGGTKRLDPTGIIMYVLVVIRLRRSDMAKVMNAEKIAEVDSWLWFDTDEEARLWVEAQEEPSDWILLLEEWGGEV